MGKWKHRLIEVDKTKKIGLCIICGEVKLKRSGNGLRCVKSAYETRKRKEYGGRVNPRVCDICGNDVRVAFDHCHKTGEFRGWLCINCNTALGLVHDDKKHLLKLVEYLSR